MDGTARAMQKALSLDFVPVRSCDRMVVVEQKARLPVSAVCTDALYLSLCHSRMVCSIYGE